MRVPLSRPYKTERALGYVKEVLASPYISSGLFINRFEKSVSEVSGAKYAISCSSGTAGLHLIIKALNISEGDEVITTPYSFIATSNVILYERAFPVFCDIEPKHFNLSYNRVEECIKKRYTWIKGKLKNKTTGRILKAIMPVHIYGYPVDMEGFVSLAKEYKLKVIEDAAEALGSSIMIGNKKRMVGAIGDAGVYAFYANKQITTGEGGIVITNNSNLRERILSIRNQGRSLSSSWLIHDRIGYNYRMSAINAAVGLSQIELLDEIIERRRKAFNRYEVLLRDIEEIELLSEGEGVETNWFVFVILFRHQHIRDRVAKYLKENGIETRPYFYPPLHLQPVYKDLLPYRKGDFPVAEDISQRVLALPFFTDITEKEQVYVSEKLKEAIEKIL